MLYPGGTLSGDAWLICRGKDEARMGSFRVPQLCFGWNDLAATLLSGKGREVKARGVEASCLSPTVHSDPPPKLLRPGRSHLHRGRG